MLQFTMATVDKKSYAYLSPVELEILTRTYSEHGHIFLEKK